MGRGAVGNARAGAVQGYRSWDENQQRHVRGATRGGMVLYSCPNRSARVPSNLPSESTVLARGFNRESPQWGFHG
jgi:hypothetical protein